MKILITGGAGFIGSNTADLLLSCGHELLIVDNLATGAREFVPERARFEQIDIRDAALDAAFAAFAPEAVVHLAAQIDVQTSIAQPAFDASVNMLGLINVLTCCVKHGARKIVFASSAAIFGAPAYMPIDEAHPTRPESGYGITKMASEHYLRIYRELHGLRYTALRFANVYGPRQGDKGEGGVVAIFKKRMLRGQDCHIYGDGAHTRDFIHVSDVARGIELALTRGDDEVINLGTGVQVSVLELYDCMARAAKIDKRPVFDPPRAGDILHSYYTIEKARNALGFAPGVTLEEGVRRFFA